MAADIQKKASDSESGSTSTPGIDIIQEMLVISDAHNARSSTLSPNEQNVREMVKHFNNQAHLPGTRAYLNGGTSSKILS